MREEGKGRGGRPGGTQSTVLRVKDTGVSQQHNKCGGLPCSPGSCQPRIYAFTVCTASGADPCQGHYVMPQRPGPTLGLKVDVQETQQVMVSVWCLWEHVHTRVWARGDMIEVTC